MALFVHKVAIGDDEMHVEQTSDIGVLLVQRDNSWYLTRDEVRDFLRVCALMDFLTDDEE